ncbi:hypothetical protein H2198_005254 [Neophaeococcomyces mojaviensis]|uniref:Uncharacterized protein n=1 Tax=Neophaeococcomyces mojaviensis TaxID=3383035 RepID=A0ACC3A6P0_9EURO|nr:hypothetical protein H2198_005254 [Knufia sp. JES_112]
MRTTVLITLLLPATSLAHFGLNYPPWRGESLTPTNTTISQWAYPCANVQSNGTRTPWPLTGGSVEVDLHHPWTYMFINLGFGPVVTNFNVSLNPGGALVNETGNGTLCYNHVALPGPATLGLTVTDGMLATLQVVTVGQTGSALYNCADIIFTSNATLLSSDQCTNSTGVSAQAVSTATNSTGSGSSATASGSSSSSTSSSGAGVLSRPSGTFLTVAAGLLGLIAYL